MISLPLRALRFKGFRGLMGRDDTEPCAPVDMIPLAKKGLTSTQGG